MDPNATYSEMLEANNSGDFATAREMARALNRWISSGGFKPENFDAKIFRRILTRGNSECYQ